MVRKDLSEPIRWNEICLGLAGIIVILFKTKNADLSFRIETPVAVEVDDTIGGICILRIAQHLFHPFQRGWATEINPHVCAERIESIEERLDGKPGIDKTGIARAADNVKDAKRQPNHAKLATFAFIELPSN